MQPKVEEKAPAIVKPAEPVVQKIEPTIHRIEQVHRIEPVVQKPEPILKPEPKPDYSDDLYDTDVDYGPVKELEIKAPPTMSVVAKKEYFDAQQIKAPAKPVASANAYKLNPPSGEQQTILKNVADGLNLMIMAVAGSGKTTTALHIALANPDKSILLFTYNEKLKTETRNKVEALGIANMEVHNFHAFGVKYYGPDCQRDIGLLNAIKNPRQFNYDIIIVDETQDMNPTYFDFVMHVCTAKTQLVIVGDKRQSIYAFNNSHPNFLTKADLIFNKSSRPWIKLPLSVSFRLTKQNANFINDVYLQKQVIVGHKEGEKPTIILTENSWQTYPVVNVIVDLLGGKVPKYKPDDIMLLAPSIKSIKCPIRKVTNSLSDKFKIPIFVPMSDESAPVTNILAGKIACLTFHQAKGLERKVVFVFGANQDYFKYIGKDENENKCPNTIYVGLTRGIEKLYVVASADSGVPKFVNELAMLAYMSGSEKAILKYFGPAKPKTVKPRKYRVSDILRHIPEEEILKCMGYFRVVDVLPAEDSIPIVCSIKSDGLVENVSDINGTAIPAYYGYITTGVLVLSKLVHAKIKYDGSVEKLLEFANIYNCELSGYKHMLNQIREYKWLPKDVLMQCVNRLKLHISGNSQFEIACSNEKEKSENLIKGAIDCIYQNTMWEFKCTSRLENAHYIQLAIYAYLYALERPGLVKDFKYKILNIISGEVKEIIVDMSSIKKMLDYIVLLKSKNHREESSAKFENILNLNTKS